MKQNRSNTLKWIVLVCFTLISCGLLILIMSALFPWNEAFQRGQNPVIISQFGQHEVNPRQKLLHLVSSPYTGYQVPGHLDEVGEFLGVQFHLRTNNYGFITQENVFPFESAKFP